MTLEGGRTVGLTISSKGTIDDRANPPAYLPLHASGELAARAERARSRLRRCVLCPRECRVNRLAGELGECRTGVLARVEGFGPHFGEEAPLVGRGGSGTIFFAGCNLTCVFCQNHEISQPASDQGLSIAGDGSDGAAAPGPAAGRRPRWEEPPERLAGMMLELQAAGCENINLVSPTHVVPQILEGLVLAVDGGLRLPLVYNTGGYDALSTLRLLDGVVDIYMPDMKYADDCVGERLSGVPDYALRNREAVLEMYRQVGDLKVDDRRGMAGCGVAGRGLLVRHLVLPGGLAGTAEVARFLAAEVSPRTYINVMDQYQPAHQAASYPEISRHPTAPEYETAVQLVLSAGLWRLDG
jgi:putative pyruvate formate lyase activating enzyme